MTGARSWKSCTLFFRSARIYTFLYIRTLYQGHDSSEACSYQIISYQKEIVKQEPWILPRLTSKELCPPGGLHASLRLTCTSRCVANTVCSFSNRPYYLPSLSLLTQLRFSIAARGGMPVLRESTPVTTPGDSHDHFKSLAVIPFSLATYPCSQLPL